MCVQQLVAVGSHWCRELETVVWNHMVNPCIIITVPEEAALYGGVQQVSDGSHLLREPRKQNDEQIKLYLFFQRFCNLLILLWFKFGS